ncbi:winged helix-turn-helix transcriptional regulator [Limosilactobacillus reuteri]|uniref:winged helix-turn-helix transcriptional regulator n=1 Tax=Limosilactobacillus reuteri TaxID=1598 RepID=UPI000A2DD324|nr:winged helix-turn-helix transcriptional regulator [Limosilactobacillus reuteri]OTA51163.1 hypothetical protein BHL90_10665 [Limosilactobacillus reuteri]
MMNLNTDQGITYSLSILQEVDYPEVLFWLGIKPLNFGDLHDLLANISNDRLITAIDDLQENYLISPIKQAGCFVLTKGGQELAHLITSLGVWGRQQMDENKGIDSVQVVMPDSLMNQKELLKYRSIVEQYI